MLPSLVGYGVLIEVLQSFTPNRSAEVSDVVADAMGIIVGRLIAAMLNRWRPWGR
ncbi:VanZ family protein [Variovorax beijingensis]|uniref:VanZ family protein n=1 Tax=Variovorax beijingensis TaxID=2496117 RepID=UPI001F0BE790|nr:VanZ family protein [Variovorax beijingensis]